jgi:hypothetical protein
LALAAMLVIVQRRSSTSSVPGSAETESATKLAGAAKPLLVGQPAKTPTVSTPAVSAPLNPKLEQPPPVTNKVERLAQIRETFRALAAGDPAAAMRAAKELTDDNERETALLTLVTEWTHGELAPSRQRAQAIAQYGLEAGLGFELSKNPELAALWARELTDGQARALLLQRAAANMLGSDPTAAFALGQDLTPDERRTFLDGLFTHWGSVGTDAALQWADKLPDPEEREAARRSIQNVAPIGIGTALSMQDGYPTINQILPRTPADLSGQLHAGDRIVALAQGGTGYVDVYNVPLSDIVQMIRGAPGTTLHLQVLPSDAPPNSRPRTVSIVRDQIKF